MKIQTLITTIACLIIPISTAYADQSFTVIADINTPAPGANSGGNFTSVAEPVIDNGQIVFRGQDGITNGLFSFQDGQLTRVVDSNTNIPGTENTFGNFSGAFARASLSNGRIAFISNGSPRGVFLFNNNQFSAVAQSQDPVPGNNNQSFLGFNNQHTKNGLTVFSGGFGAFTSGIFVSENGNDVISVIDSLDARPIPGVNQNFFSFTPNDIAGGNIIFTGGGFNTNTGIYESTVSGSISVVVDINTAIPDGTGTFTFFDTRFPNVDDGQIVFVGAGSNSQSGIYLVDGNGITKVADRNTLQPGSTNPFSDLREPIVDDGRVFFQGNGSEGLGIYKFEDGEITRLFRVGDVIDGRTVTSIVQNVLDVEGNRLVCHVILNSVSTILAVDLFSRGDLNCDGIVDLLDIQPFVQAIAAGEFDAAADINQDGIVNLLDIEPFRRSHQRWKSLT